MSKPVKGILYSCTRCGGEHFEQEPIFDALSRARDTGYTVTYRDRKRKFPQQKQELWFCGLVCLGKWAGEER